MKKESNDMEWMEEYPALKQVSPVSPFVVPTGYFEGLEEEVMGHIRLLELGKTTGNEGFTVPENYFDELQQNIQSRIAIEHALAGGKSFTVPENYFDGLQQNIQSRITIEQALAGEKSFTVPESYFDELQQNIQSRITIEEALNTENSFTVPENYFEDLTQNIQARVAAEEALGATPAFKVPEGYFADLENKILQQTTQAVVQPNESKQGQGVIVKLLVSKTFKYASAACFALVVGGAIFISEFNNPVAKHNRSYLHKELSKVPNDELESYLELNNDSPAILDNIDPDSFDAQMTELKAQDKTN